MSVRRGDIVLLNIPFSSGKGSKVRPALVVQSDHNNGRLSNTIVATITSTVTRAKFEPTQLLVDINSPEGLQSGLLAASSITCENLLTIQQRHIIRTIGSLTPELMRRVDECLKVSLELR